MATKSKITYDTRISLLEHLPGMHYVEVPASIIKKLGGKIKIRLICTLNDSVSYQCGLVSLGEGKAYITVNAKRLKELKLKVGDVVAVNLEKDDSEYGLEMPAELSELLSQDPIGEKRFKGLKPGMQRYILFYIGQVKSSQLRIDRVIKLIGNLKKLKPGTETFRSMLGIED
ncbi:hypothetical protein BH11BAC2_BH11BAC2_10310 [soil metagenome]